MNMQTKMDVGLIIGYTSLYDEDEELIDLLSEISRSTILQMASFFLGFDNLNSKYQESKEFVKMFFSNTNRDFAKNAINLIDKFEKKTQKETGFQTKSSIINHFSSLNLFEYAFSSMKEQKGVSNEESEIRIFKAYLLINDKYHNKQIQGLDEAGKDDNFSVLSKTLLMMQFRTAELTDFNKKELIVVQVIKSIYYFEFLSSNKKTLILIKKFIETYDVKDWEEFLVRIVPIIFESYKKEKESYLDVIIADDDYQKKNRTFVENIVINDLEALNQYDFISLRASPLYKVNDSLFRVVFEPFLIDMIYMGVYFKMSEINNELEKELKVKGFRSLSCKEFSENVILYKTMEAMYGKKYIKFTGETLEKMGYSAEPDYYLRNGNKLFLFESKDVLIRAEDKFATNYEVLEEVLKKKFYFDKNKKGKIENKAILQLINNISRIFRNEFKFDTNYKACKLDIYPILITHHRQFNTSGLNSILKEWFNEELISLSRLGIDVSRVRAITIIHIDDLIYNQEQFMEGRIKLEKVIDDYLNYVDFDKKRKYNSTEDVKFKMTNTSMSFSVFLDGYVRRKSKKRTPKILLEKGDALFSSKYFENTKED